MSKGPKLKFSEPKGVITFDGKLVKLAPQKKTDKFVNKNYTSTSNSDCTLTDCDPALRFKLKTKFKSKSKSKSKNTEISLTKHTKILDNKDLRRTMGSEERELIRKTILTDDTQVTPKKFNYERN